MKRRLLFLTSTIIFLVSGYRPWKQTSVQLGTDKQVYFHYDFVQITARITDKTLKLRLQGKKLYVLVTKGIHPVLTVGRRFFADLEYDQEKDCWRGKWPIPWNAPECEYTLRLWISPHMGKGIKVKETKFLVSFRKRNKLVKGLCVMTMENMKPLTSMRVKGPDGEIGDWRKLFDWVEFSGANTFWYMAGQTSAYVRRIGEDFPWNPENLALIDDLAKEAERRSIDFGFWVQCFLSFGPQELRPRYEYAWDYKADLGKCIVTRGISIRDKKRIKDIIEFIKRFSSIEEVDYIGLDYVRTAENGLELVDEFVREMEVKVPDGWWQLSKIERMEWLANIVERRRQRNSPVIDQWNWWRAREIALVVKRIKEEAGIQKPLYLFNLTWEKGWQHGQDVVMMSDAGADIIALMLYEADKKQFNSLVRDWQNYLKEENDLNIIAGDVYDWPLHQFALNPAGPEEFYTRIVKAMEGIYPGRVTAGVFTHDLGRVLWGRRGPYPTMEWVIAGASCFTRLREEQGLTPIRVQVKGPDRVNYGKEFSLTVMMENYGKQELRKVSISFLCQEGVICVSQDHQEIESLPAGETRYLEFRLKIVQLGPERGSRYMMPVKVVWEEGRFPSYAFKYVSLVQPPE